MDKPFLARAIFRETAVAEEGNTFGVLIYKLIGNRTSFVVDRAAPVPGSVRFQKGTDEGTYYFQQYGFGGGNVYLEHLSFVPLSAQYN